MKIGLMIIVLIGLASPLVWAADPVTVDDPNQAATTKEPDWAAEAARWEGRALENGTSNQERGRFYFNAATAILQNASPSQADLDRALAFLQRSASLAPDLRQAAARNWEIARAMQQQTQKPDQKPDQKQDQKNQDQKQDQKQDQQSGSGQDQKQQNQNQKNQNQQNQNQPNQNQKQDLSKDIAGLQQRQAQQNQKGTSAAEASNQDALAQDTQAAQAKADKESTRANLEQAKQAMQSASAALKKGDQKQATKDQQAALAALQAAAKSEKDGTTEDVALRELAQKEKEYRQLKALLHPQPAEKVEKNW